MTNVQKLGGIKGVKINIISSSVVGHIQTKNNPKTIATTLKKIQPKAILIGRCSLYNDAWQNPIRIFMGQKGSEIVLFHFLYFYYGLLQSCYNKSLFMLQHAHSSMEVYILHLYILQNPYALQQQKISLLFVHFIMSFSPSARGSVSTCLMSCSAASHSSFRS